MARSLLLAALGTSVFLPLDAFAQTAATLDDETEAAEDSKNEPRGSLGDASDPAATESLKDPETKAEA